MTPEQQRALALARARLRLREQEAPAQATRPGSVIGADVGAPLPADENARALARRRATEQEDADEGFRRLATPLGGGLSRVLTDPFTDPDNRRRMGANLAATWRGIDRATRRDPYDEISEEEMAANRQRFVRQAAPQISAAARHQFTREGEAERARAITGAASTVGRGVARQFTREGEAERAQVVRAAPRVAGDIGRAITYGPFVDQPRAQRELRITRHMQEAGFSTQEEVDALADESLRQSGHAAINLAFAPEAVVLAAKGGAQTLRGGAQALRGLRPGVRPGPRPGGARITPRQAAEEQRTLDEALTRDLESEFGTLTAGERARDPVAMQREESLRRAGPAQQTMQSFDDARAQQFEENIVRRLVTRDLPPQNPDYASTGNTLADSLRSQREAQLARRAQWYDRAMTLGADDAIAPTDELLNTVLATSREHFGNLDNAAINIVRQLHEEIASGRATYSRVERARQALNAELGAAMRDPRGGPQVMAIHRIIDDLDAFAAPRVRPETRQAILEARRLNREIAEAYGEQLRPELATGQTGRRDMGGATVRRILESDMVGARVMDTIFGAGAKPTQASFAAIRRIVTNAKRQIVSRGEAPTGAAVGRSQRTAGAETLRPGRGTRGGRTFDPSPAQQERFGAELPREDFQALREAFAYRLTQPLTDRAAGGAIPFGKLANNLRQALDGHSREITELLLNPAEIAQARRLLRLLEQATPPPGAYSPSGPLINQDAIERSLGAMVGRLVGRVPGLEGIGEGIRAGVVKTQSMRAARAATEGATVPRAPRSGVAGVPVTQRGAAARARPGSGVSPIRAYHSTGVDIEDGFRPGSHFGTSDAANARLRDERVTEGARVYPVDLPQGRYLRVPDAGHSWRSGRYWQESARKELNAAIPPEERAVWRAIENDRELSMARGEEVTTRLGQILREHGFEGGVYRNRWEGGESYFMPDTGRVRSATSRKRAPEGGGGGIANGLANIGTAGAIGLGAAAGDAQAQTTDANADAELAAVRQEVTDLTNEKRRFDALIAAVLAQREGAPEHEQAVKDLQRYLNANGASIRVDGDWKGLTQGARNAYAEGLDARLSDAQERRDEAVQAQGERRTRTSDEVQAARLFGPLAALPIGYGLGFLGRRAIARGINRERDRVVDAANRRVSSMRSMTDPQRAMRMNDVFREGLPPGRRGRVPYAPGGRHGFKRKPGEPAADISELYTPGNALVREPDLVLGGLATADIGYAGTNLMQANAEVARAREALAQPGGNTEANRRDLENALNSQAFWDSMLRLGYTSAAGLGHGIASHRYSRRRPNTEAIEQEQRRLNQILNPPRSPKSRRPQ